MTPLKNSRTEENLKAAFAGESQSQKTQAFIGIGGLAVRFERGLGSRNEEEPRQLEFFAGGHEGVVWVHGYGNVFEKNLDPGETIDIEPGGWVFRDHSVQMSQEVYGFKTGFLGGGGNLVFNRFTGPGRVGLQSAYFHPPVAEGAGGAAQREGGGGVIGGIVGDLLKG